jgi:hypothetical protein
VASSFANPFAAVDAHWHGSDKILNNSTLNGSSAS